MEDEASDRGYPVGHVERKCVRCLENDIIFIIINIIEFILSTIFQNCGLYMIHFLKDIHCIRIELYSMLK